MSSFTAIIESAVQQYTTTIFMEEEQIKTVVILVKPVNIQKPLLTVATAVIEAELVMLKVVMSWHGRCNVS